MSELAEPISPKVARKESDLLANFADRFRPNEKNARTLFLSVTCLQSLQRRSRRTSETHPAPDGERGRIPAIPGELFAKFQISFYSGPREAAFKSLRVESAL